LALSEFELVEIGHERSVLIVPKGKEVRSLKPLLDEYLTVPERRRGVSTHKTLLSLIEHANRFKSEHSVLFADPGDRASVNPVLLSVLNYNPAGDALTGHGDHRGRYSFPLSEQWKAWKAIDGKPKNVRDFSNFLERQIEDLGDPASPGKIAQQIPDRLGYRLATPTDVLKLSKGLSLVVDHTVTNIVDNTTGETKLQFEQAHKDKAGKPLEVIKAFVLNIPVFESGALYTVGVRLTYEVQGETVAFTCHLYREDLYFKDAFENACEEARRGTSLPLFFGSPE
jgi:uncharacterized protein YfdQ (DUF2303 family)